MSMLVLHARSELAYRREVLAARSFRLETASILAALGALLYMLI